MGERKIGEPSIFPQSLSDIFMEISQELFMAHFLVFFFPRGHFASCTSIDGIVLERFFRKGMYECICEDNIGICTKNKGSFCASYSDIFGNHLKKGQFFRIGIGMVYFGGHDNVSHTYTGVLWWSGQYFMEEWLLGIWVPFDDNDFCSEGVFLYLMIERFECEGESRDKIFSMCIVSCGDDDA